MSTTSQDFEAVQEAVETLEENGFQVRTVNEIFGYEDVDFDVETEEEEELGRKTKFELSVSKEHY